MITACVVRWSVPDQPRDQCVHNPNAHLTWGFLGGSAVKNPLAMQEMRVQPLGQEDPLEKEMVAHSSILAWEIP